MVRNSIDKGSQKGFTLIELLVMVGIISVVTAVGMASYNQSLSTARDITRKSNLKELATALELYYQKNNSYISGITSCQANPDPAQNPFYSAIRPFLQDQILPKDPQTGQAYCYISGADGSSYRLYAKLATCSASDNPLCGAQQYNYSLISENLTSIIPAPDDSVASTPAPSISPCPTASPTPTPSATPTPAPSATPTPAWVEGWDSLSEVQSRWNNIGSSCYSVPTAGTLDMACQSAGLVSNQFFDKTQPLTVTGTVRAQPNTGSTTDAYWSGLTIYNNNGADDNYGELAVERDVPPFSSDHTARVVSLTDNVGAALLLDIPWTWHTFKIVYSPTGSYDYFVDTNLVRTVSSVPLSANPNIFVLCASVGAGVSGDGSSAHCQFGPISVYGALAAAPSPTPNPSPTQGPSPVPDSLLTNASFENQLNSWTCQGAVSGTCTPDSATKYSGNFSAKVINTGGSWGWQLAQGNIAVAAGDQFCLSAEVKKQNASDNVALAIQEQTNWSALEIYPLSNTNWQLIRGTLTIPSSWNGHAIQAYLREYASSTVWFDDIALTRGGCL